MKVSFMFCNFCSKPCNSKFCSLSCVGLSLKARRKAEYDLDPKKCHGCALPIPYEDRVNKFCTQTCSAKFNNTGRIRSEESKKKTSDALRRPDRSYWCFDWLAVQAYYDTGKSIRACQKEFGFSSSTCTEAKSRGLFFTRPPQTFDLERGLVENSTAKRGELKKRLIETGLLPNRCAKCERGAEWMGEPLILILDHINGINNDSRLENLRLLCPNCNSQTTTFCRGAAKKKTAVKAKDLVDALKATASIKEALGLVGMDPTGNNYARITRLLS